MQTAAYARVLREYYGVTFMYWFLLKILALTFLPLPIHPKLTRPDPKKNFWTFECDEFKSPYELAKLVYLERHQA